jgi:hypothetical protein
MLLTYYYGVQTIATLAFSCATATGSIRFHLLTILTDLLNLYWLAIPVKLLKIIAYGILFSRRMYLPIQSVQNSTPIQILYDTSGLFFQMGLLITYSNKFYTFLKN